jgi:anti-anti-sigma regulatory factor
MHRLLVPSSPSQDSSAVAEWIAAAVERREKVLYKHAPSEDPAAVLQRSLPAAGIDTAVLTSGQVQLADTTNLRAETGGRHEALYALHLHQLRQATRDGFTGLTLTGDAAAMHTITRDEHELAGYERDLQRLTVEAGVRSLCRYPRTEDPGLLGDMLAVHHRNVVDDALSVAMVDDRLSISGELDFDNADRFTLTLRAALAAGVRTVDASGLTFCDVAGLRALVAATGVLPGTALPLPVVGVDGLLVRILALTDLLDRRVLHVTERHDGAQRAGPA